MHAPTNVASEIGVLRTRVGPNSSISPRVAPMIERSTSSPITTTLSSSAIASRMPACIARMK